MANNEYLPFAEDLSANVISQAAYAALAARGAGFSSGIAKSAEANKVWRQANSIASMIGQFIADMSLLDALDNGDLATLEARFQLALRNSTTRRTLITQNTTIYVDPAIGNDANNGLTPATPFLTIQAAINSAYQFYDWNGYNCTIQLAHGTYTYSVSGGTQASFFGNMTNMRPFGLTLNGDSLNQDTVVLNNVNSSGIGAFGIFMNVNGLKVTSSGTVWTPVLAQGVGLASDAASRVQVSNCTFDTVTQMQLWALHGGSIVLVGNNNKFQGTCNYGWIAQEAGLVYATSIAITNNSTYNVVNAYATESASIWTPGVTWIGTVTGKRYWGTGAGFFQTGGGGPNYFPGTVVGTLDANSAYY